MGPGGAWPWALRLQRGPQGGELATGPRGHPVGPAISCGVISPCTSWPEPAFVRMHSSAVIPAPWGFSVDVDGVRTPGDQRVTPTQKQVPALLPTSQSLPQRLRVAPRQPAPQPLWAQAQVNVQREQTSVKEALTQSQKEGECPEETGVLGAPRYRSGSLHPSAHGECGRAHPQSACFSSEGGAFWD